MFIFKIFRIKKQVKDIREGVHDPARFAGKQIIGAVRGYIVFLALVTVVVLGLLFIFGYTNLFTESSGFARAIFWILFVPLGVFWFVVCITFCKVKRLMRQAHGKFKRETIHVKATVPARPACPAERDKLGEAGEQSTVRDATEIKEPEQLSNFQ